MQHQLWAGQAPTAGAHRVPHLRLLLLELDEHEAHLDEPDAHGRHEQLAQHVPDNTNAQ